MTTFEARQAAERRSTLAHQIDWTDERVAYLTKRWKEGASAGQIAFEMGEGISRSAVIGKVHRLKLARRSKGTSMTYVRRPTPVAKPTPRPVTLKPKPVRAPQAVRPPIPVERFEEADEGVDFTSRVGILGLTTNTCRYPVSTPWQPPYEFCGAPVAAEQVYCEHHCRKAYKPVGSAA